MSNSKSKKPVKVHAQSWRDATPSTPPWASAWTPEELLEKSLEKLRQIDWHPYPWKWGTWVSIDGGTIYRGNGGNEREESYWFSRGPWILIGESTLAGATTGPLLADLKTKQELIDQTKAKVKELAESLDLIKEEY